MKPTVVLPFALLLGGCYSYAPADPARLPANAQVAATLTTRGSAAYEARLGPDIDYVEGRFVAMRGDSVELALTRTRDRRSTWVDWTGEHVVLAPELVTGFRQRSLSRTRTALLAGGLVAAVATGAAAGLNGFSDGGSTRDPGGPGPKPGGQ